jgi:hypothetical protein
MIAGLCLLMLPRRSSSGVLVAVLFCALCTALSHAEQTHAASVPAVPVLVVDNLGKGAAPLDGPWQFHPGDDPAWAAASFDDSSWGR